MLVKLTRSRSYKTFFIQWPIIFPYFSLKLCNFILNAFNGCFGGKIYQSELSTKSLQTVSATLEPFGFYEFSCEPKYTSCLVTERIGPSKFREDWGFFRKFLVELPPFQKKSDPIFWLCLCCKWFILGAYIFWEMALSYSKSFFDHLKASILK